jgi:ParB family chromosome partitioning protein
MAFANDRRSEMLKENEDLKKRVGETELIQARLEASQKELQHWDGAQAVRALDPNIIGRSQFANRHELNFQGSEFAELKEEIANAGKNIQPIKVRPVNKKTGGFDYEIVFGHRRHEACRQLGIDVFAIIDNLDDQALFVEMDRENRARKDLSPWEQGVMYSRAISSGLFTSNKKLADSIGVDLGLVGKAITLAELPAVVISAFDSPMDLQYRWAKPLNDSLKLDPAGFANRVKELASFNPRKKAAEAFLVLTSEGGLNGSTPHFEVVVNAAGRQAAVISTNKKGLLQVVFNDVLSESKAKRLAKFLEELLLK